jgi:uncharacterized damage-inducible protein DinB
LASVLVELYKHNLWANLCLFDACAPLPVETLDTAIEGTYGTIRQTLAHIANAERGYVARIREEDRPASLPETAGVDEMRERVRRSGEAMIAIAEETDADRPVQTVFQGKPYALPLSILLIQAINHATDHRSQICTILTQQGVEPPDLQGWAYLDVLTAHAGASR